MTIIDQLEKTLTPAILGEKHDVASISLLEQFYALLIAHLASVDTHSQLLRNQSLAVESNNSIFEQLWPYVEQRQLIIDELSVTHHIDKFTTNQLITNATHLGYQALKNLANGQFLPAFLQAQQATIRQYLPVWAPTVISASMPATKESLTANTDAIDALKSEQLVSEVVVLEKKSPKAVAEKHRAEDSNEFDDFDNIDNIEHGTSIGTINSSNIDDTNDSSALHINPSTYRTAETMTENSPNHKRNSQRSQWLIPLLLLIIAITALALLWFSVIQPKYMQLVLPAVIEPVVIVAEEPTASASPPIELTVAIDDSGDLYSCSASVGDVALQSALQQALNTSFAERASICELIVQQGVATTVTAMDIESLPEILALVRSVPFARMQLQDDSLSLEAPDERLLQQLVTDIRALLPNTAITAVASLVLPDNDNVAINDSAMNNIDDEASSQFNNEFIETDSNRNANSNPSYDRNYQQSDDDSNDQVIPASSRNNVNHANSAINNNVNNNNFNDRNQAAGLISLAEVENLANSAIVAEPLRNTRSVDRNINPNN